MARAMANDSRRLKFAYYCSGHGYGHATRVSAFARHLLALDCQPTVYIVSSAPKHVFSDSIAQGALYRNAEIDPVIVQPLAYRVDRKKSVEVLKKFLESKDTKVRDEAQWLKSIGADCVLSDAAFLGCLAAHHAAIPSVLITNFSFDSVYSYLSTSLIDEIRKPDDPAIDALLSLPTAKDKLEPDVPIPHGVIAPLVDHIHSGYRCADLLLRLPGTIPIPSFAAQPCLPSPNWVDIEARCFKPLVVDHLTELPDTHSLLPLLPFPDHRPRKPLGRQVRAAPLLVRSPDPSVYTPEGRSRLLESIGVPAHLHDPKTTKILIVSFGGQVFHKPHSRSHSRAASSVSTPAVVPPILKHLPNGGAHAANGTSPPKQPPTPAMEIDDPMQHAQALNEALRRASMSTAKPPRPILARMTSSEDYPHGRPRALSQLRIDGAPPAAVPTSPRATTMASLPSLSSVASLPSFPVFQTITIPPSPGDESETPRRAWNMETMRAVLEEDLEEDVRILPDDSWIAVVCGVPKDWGREDGEELPERFFVAPRDVYMPDLTAVADVLLGKLGYGTVSECVDACTPFVYVPRPLFIEEHGLRLYLDRQGVGVELSRTHYEVGEWADAIEEAYVKGRDAKARKREIGETGHRKEEGREMAQYVVDWVERWQAAVGSADGLLVGKQEGCQADQKASFQASDEVVRRTPLII